MENSEILGFQFEPTKALQPDSSSGESLGIFSSADSELSEMKHQLIICAIMCFNCSQISTTKECLC